MNVSFEKWWFDKGVIVYYICCRQENILLDDIIKYYIMCFTGCSTVKSLRLLLWLSFKYSVFKDIFLSQENVALLVAEKLYMVPSWMVMAQLSDLLINLNADILLFNQTVGECHKQVCTLFLHGVQDTKGIRHKGLSDLQSQNSKSCSKCLPCKKLSEFLRGFWEMWYTMSFSRVLSKWEVLLLNSLMDGEEQEEQRSYLWDETQRWMRVRACTHNKANSFQTVEWWHVIISSMANHVFIRMLMYA